MTWYTQKCIGVDVTYVLDTGEAGRITNLLDFGSVVEWYQNTPNVRSYTIHMHYKAELDLPREQWTPIP